MPHPFDGHSFSRVLADAERLATDARDHERRLTALVSAMEASLESRTAGPDPSDWLDAVRAVCLAAGDQRNTAEQIVGRLASDVERLRGVSQRRGRVLVVDDSDDNRELAAVVLESSGYQSMTASNGLEALIVAHYAAPAVVLMDIAMPVLGGIESARLLKASSVTRGIPVLAYTATPITADGWLARLFTEVVRKPASPDDIVGAVTRTAKRAD